ncbi:MAG: hypothetical protein ACT4O3_06765 [Elusimicrobiota bacterium]
MCALLALSAGGTLRAAPTVTNVTGETGHGGTLTLRGAGFGTHGDFHPSGGKLLHLFDDFNDGDLLSNPYETWQVFASGNGAVDYQCQRPRTSLPGDCYYRRKSVGLGNLFVKSGNHGEYYSSFYMRLSEGFNVSSGPGTKQFKIVRLTSVNKPVNFYPAIGAGDGFHFMIENTKPIVVRHQLQLGSIPDRPSGWNHLAVYYKKSSTANSNDGHCRVWWNHRLVFDWRTHFQNPANNPSSAPGYPIQGDFDTDGADLAQDWSIGNYFSSASPSTWVDFDDVYLSHTLARVELGNAPSYEACSVLEAQIPLEWSDRSIRVQVNAGAHRSGFPAYVYVTDARGAVNPAGYPLSVGQPVAAAGAPLVRIEAPEDTTVDARRIAVGLSGTADGEADIVRVTWSTDRGASGSASGTTDWSISDVPLGVGRNIVTVKAQDASGRVGTAELEFMRGGEAAEGGLKPAQKFLAPTAGPQGDMVFGKAVQVEVLDQDGRLVFSKSDPNGGIVWDGRDASGNIVPSGVYICKIKGPGGEMAYHSVAVVK